MASFSYSARQKSGAVTRGSVYALDRAAAASSLIEKGLVPILIKEESKQRAGGLLGKLKLGGGKVKLKDKVIFSRQFSTMINAGVPIAKSLAILREQTASKKLQGVVADI